MKTKKFMKDAAALLGFPWSKPAEPTSRSTTSSGFVETVSDSELTTVYKRNPAAHAVVSDVAQDVMSSFECTTVTDGELKEFSGDVKDIYEKMIREPMTRALTLTRLYGFCGILIGYADGGKLEEPVKGNPKITYLQPIPKNWVSEVVMAKAENGGIKIPLEIEKYVISISHTNMDVDASRIIHLENKGIDEESPEGESSLLCIYDDLTTLKSGSWGAGQAMWRNGGGLTVFVAPDSSDQQTQIDAIDDVVTDLNAMTVLTMPFGTQVFTGSTGSLNPKPYLDVNLELIAIGSRIPVSILRGSVAGSLTASEKDRKDYFELLENIQKNITTKAMMRILERMQEAGQLSEQKFLISWNKSMVYMLEESRAQLIDAQKNLTEEKTATEQAKGDKERLEYQTIKEQRDLWNEN